jgi:hypothetical protein
MENKIFVGSGVEFGKYGDVNIDICLSDLPAEYRVKSEKNGKVYIKLTVSKKKEKDQYGKTHSVTINTWKPEKKKDNSDNMPF